jgi:uncharacterized protein
VVKKLRDYEIGIAKLSNKKHEYEFDMDDSFFDLFGGDIILGGKLLGKVELDKTETLLTLNFDINGHVRLACDRSLEEFNEPVSIQETFRMKFGTETKELDDDLWEIASDTQSINVAQHLYDFIGTSLPMKKLHPRFREEDEDQEEEAILIYSSRHADEGDNENDDSDDDDDVDPRWDALKNLN